MAFDFLKTRQQRLFAILTFALLLAVLPWVLSGGFENGKSWLRAVDFALLYIMLALGLNIVVGYAGLLDLGYIAFYAVGAYLYSFLNSPHLAAVLPAWMMYPPLLVMLLLAAVVAGMFGVLLGSPTLKLRGDYLAIVTLGFGEIVRIFMNNLDRPINITNGPQGINGIAKVHLFGLDFGKPIQWLGLTFEVVHAYYYLILAFCALIIFVTLRLQHSRIGRAWVAIREDEIAASAMGINTRNIKLLAFAMGASFGGVSGALFASFQGFVSPESFVLMESVMVLCMVVLGGMGHIPGVILGAIIVSITPEILRDIINPVQNALFGKRVLDPENLRMLIFGLAMIIIMLLRPEGLWPSKRRKAEFHEHDKEAAA
ncbi:branched-chain amino acid transport system permease protein [Andreprevotia lacus DSM 23236]|jgi:branched-chain amino acid transport system permease protein|uniref:Branched-chain amino acid transport system permease protein n=1 Tax=Andreprevotia lacus DSM 23236 TaxID=1121001 RepID=A0A1W1XWJ8_9NEIS|nr:ABC transporter ATP-binding protein [Andreprevotia lacus]SMC28306.1 branched-chain amino acid transport system permease protein [Andreprevotia lacus DSM 23236]